MRKISKKKVYKHKQASQSIYQTTISLFIAGSVLKICDGKVANETCGYHCHMVSHLFFWKNNKPTWISAVETKMKT